MSWSFKAIVLGLLLIVLVGSTFNRSAAKELYADVPLDELPFVISADGLTETQIRAALQEIGEIPDGAYVSIIPFKYTRADFEAGVELPFSHDRNELPLGFSIKPLDDPKIPTAISTATGMSGSMRTTAGSVTSTTTIS